ncbi:MAG: glycosyltransferase [Chloroflexota bacterium]
MGGLPFGVGYHEQFDFDAFQTAAVKQAAPLYKKIKTFLSVHQIQVIHVEMVLGHILCPPLTFALRKLIEQDGVVAISRSYDFPWDSTTLHRQALHQVLRYFPVVHPHVLHLTQTKFGLEGIQKWCPEVVSRSIPNFFPFTINEADYRGQEFRESLGVKPQDLLLLQPSRVEFKKGPHHSIHLAGQLKHRTGQSVTVAITGKTYPIWGEYKTILNEIAQAYDIKLVFLEGAPIHQFGDPNGQNTAAFSITDAFLGADIITIASLNEGFGNTNIEAVAAKRLLFANEYKVMTHEFLPHGFDFILMQDPFTDIQKIAQILTEPDRDWVYQALRRTYNFDDSPIPVRAIDRVVDLLQNPQKRQAVIEANWHIGAKVYNKDQLGAYLEPIKAWIENQLN